MLVRRRRASFTPIAANGAHREHFSPQTLGQQGFMAVSTSAHVIGTRCREV
jgi:hypothetical protein